MLLLSWAVLVQSITKVTVSGKKCVSLEEILVSACLALRIAFYKTGLGDFSEESRALDKLRVSRSATILHYLYTLLAK